MLPIPPAARETCAAGDCVVIANESTLDPGAFEYKYYAKALGKLLETKLDDGEFVALIECNFVACCEELAVEDDEGDEDE